MNIKMETAVLSDKVSNRLFRQVRFFIALRKSTFEATTSNILPWTTILLRSWKAVSTSVLKIGKKRKSRIIRPSIKQKID